MGDPRLVRDDQQRHPYPVERLPRAAVRVRNAVAEEVGQEHVLQRGEGGKQVEALEDEPDLGVPQGRKLRIGDGAQIAAEHQRLSYELAVQTAQDVQQRALAAAALALDRHELPAAHGQVDAAQQILWKGSRLPRRVLLGDAAQLDGAHGATSSTSRLPPRRSGNASAATVRRTVRRGSMTCPTSERATYDCGPVPKALWGSSRRAAASWPKSTRSAVPALS